MKLGITTDSNREARISEIIFGANAALREYFADRSYDDSGIDFFFVLMCRDPELNFKQRIRFLKKDNTLYMDIMLDLEQMKRVDTQTGRSIVAEKMLKEIPGIISKYKFKGFDLPRFLSDLKDWFEKNRWM